MKKPPLVVFLILLFPAIASASEVSFEEAIGYLSKTVTLHKPKILVQIEGGGTSTEEAYDYPALDIKPLWKKLGVSSDVFKDWEGNCEPGKSQCILVYPETELIERDDLKVIRITRSTAQDLQYLFFIKKNKKYSYLDHFEYDTQKYEEPEFKFLDDGLISIKVLAEHGTNIICYLEEFFQINPKGLKKILSYVARHERSLWGMIFDETIASESVYKDGVLTIKYRIKVTMTDYYYDSKVAGKLSEDPVVDVEKTLAYRFKTDNFVADKASSTISPEAIESLRSGGYKDFYGVFKKEFDTLEDKDSKTQEWLEFFRQEVKNEI